MPHQHFRVLPPPPKDALMSCLKPAFQLAVLYLFCLDCKTLQLRKSLPQINCSLHGLTRRQRAICHFPLFSTFQGRGSWGALGESRSQTEEYPCWGWHRGRSEAGLDFRAPGSVSLGLPQASDRGSRQVVRRVGTVTGGLQSGQIPAPTVPGPWPCGVWCLAGPTA